jgi:predicted transcriptional regulator
VSDGRRERRVERAVPDMLAYMKRTTLKIPDALDARLRHEAERRGLTISEVSREALEAYLIGPSGRRRLAAAKAGRSGRADVSERIEEILAAEIRR